MPCNEKDPKPAPLTREQKLAQALRANLRRRKLGDHGGGQKAPDTKSGAGD